MKHGIGTITLIAALSLFASCAARYDVRVSEDGSASVGISASLGPRAANLIAQLAGTPADGAPAPLDAAAVSRALETAAGFRSARLGNPDPRTLSGSIELDRIDGFLAPRFVSVERGTDGGGSVAVRLDRGAAAELLASLSPDLSDYLSALMAPIAGGEALSGGEYLELLTAVYGAGIAREMEESRIAVSLRLPGPVVSVSGGSAAGNAAEFSLPLIDLLTLDRPLFLEAAWR